MNKRMKQAYDRKLLRAGFQQWQIEKGWDGFKRRNWRRLATRVFGVKP